MPPKVETKDPDFTIIDQSVSLQFWPKASRFQGVTQLRIRLERPSPKPACLHLGPNLKVTKVLVKDVEIAKRSACKHKSKEVSKYTRFGWSQIDSDRVNQKVKQHLSNTRRDLDGFQDMRHKVHANLDKGQLFLDMGFKDNCKYKDKEAKLYEKMCLFYTAVVHFESESVSGALAQLKVKTRKDEVQSVIFKKGFLESARWLFPCVDRFGEEYYFSLIRVTVPKEYRVLVSGLLDNEVVLSSGVGSGVNKVETQYNTTTHTINVLRHENQHKPQTTHTVPTLDQLQKRDFETFKKTTPPEWKMFEYRLERKCVPSHIGFVVGPFARLESKSFVDEVWYLKDHFEQQKEISDILKQFSEYEQRIFGQDDFFKPRSVDKKQSDNAALKQEKLRMVILPGLFNIDSTHLRESLESARTECVFHANMFLFSEEVFLDERHLEMFHVGLGLALKYKFLSYFVRNVRLDSPKGTRD